MSSLDFQLCLFVTSFALLCQYIYKNKQTPSFLFYHFTQSHPLISAPLSPLPCQQLLFPNPSISLAGHPLHIARPCTHTPSPPMVVTAGDSQSRCYTNSTHHWSWCWCWCTVGVSVAQIPHEAGEPFPQHPSQYHHQPGTSQSIGPYQPSGHQNPFTPPPTNTPRGSNGAMGETARFISSHEQMSHGHI